MSITWTKDQQKVIDTRNTNLLVSAAAGSGKTAVLVERILSLDYGRRASCGCGQTSDHYIYQSSSRGDEGAHQQGSRGKAERGSGK